MFGIGMTELLIILGVALVFLGPAKLPEVARSLAKGLRELRRASDDIRTSIMVDIDEPPAYRPPPENHHPALGPASTAGADVSSDSIPGSVATAPPDEAEVEAPPADPLAQSPAPQSPAPEGTVARDAAGFEATGAEKAPAPSAGASSATADASAEKKSAEKKGAETKVAASSQALSDAEDGASAT